MSSSFEVSAQDVAINAKCFRYLKIKSVCLRLRSFLVLSLKSFDPAGGVDQFLLACEKGMTFRADFEMNLRFRRARPESLTACASDDRIDVIRMYIGFH